MEETLEALYLLAESGREPSEIAAKEADTMDFIFSKQLRKELEEGLDKQKLKLLDRYLGNLEIRQERERRVSFQHGLTMGLRLGTMAR